jgi:crossover junction endodeoxyribonuclease RuvC
VTTIVAVDPSLSSTGLVAWRDGRFYVSTVATSARTRIEERHHHIVMRILGMRDPDPTKTLVVMEGRITPGEDAVQTAMDLAELRGVINHGIYSARLAKVDVHPSTLKVYATGNGRANKAAMKAAALGRLGTHTHVANDDEADALWLAAIALDHYGRPLCGMPAKHRAAVGKPPWPPFTLEALP